MVPMTDFLTAVLSALAIYAVLGRLFVRKPAAATGDAAPQTARVPAETDGERDAAAE
jgi:hypothetical protein